MKMNRNVPKPFTAKSFVNQNHLSVMQVLPGLVTGGVERGTIDIAIAVAKAGGKSIVVSSGGPMTLELERNGINHFQLPVDSKNPFVMIKNIKKLQNLILTENINITHARSRAPAWSAWRAAIETNTSFVTTFHGTYSYNNWLKRQYNSIMTKGERVIAISNFIAGHILKNYGVPRKQIRVIPRGIDLEKYNPSNISHERIIKLAHKWRMPDDKRIIMLPGRLSRWKGHRVFIEAIKILQRADVQCLIVGSDRNQENYRNELQDHIIQLGLHNKIHVVGHCDDMPAAYMLTDLVISASTDPEAFGRVAIEAQALGRLVIGTNHGGSKESIFNEKTGWLVEPNDPIELAFCLNDILNVTNEKRAEIAKNAMNHARQYYSKETMCSKTLDVYNELAPRDAAVRE